MSLRDIGKVCLFSGMSGVVLKGGKPVANAKVKRVVSHAFSSGSEEDETITDEDGRFSMPPVFERTIGKYLPAEFSVGQQIYVYHQGVEYKIWSGVKRTPEENAESRGKPLEVNCELSSEIKLIEVNGGPIFSLCTWDVEPDNVDTGF